MVGYDRTPFHEIAYDEPFCQGDILHSDDGHNGGLGTFGVIITADCDIAQGKDGGEFSTLHTITAEQYVANNWARTETRKLVDRQIGIALEALNAAIAQKDTSLQPLSQASLTAWLDDQDPEAILDAVGIMGKSSRSEIARALNCAATRTTTTDEVPLNVLKGVWNLLGTSEKNIRARLADVLDPSRGPPDMYFIPYLPGFAEIGFIIQLRSFGTIPRDQVFHTKTDAKLTDHSRKFYRIGRFRDGVKYSIVQRMVNLFSRVGLSDDYEEESASAAHLVVDTIHSYVRGN